MPVISGQGANISCACLGYSQQQPGDLAFYKQQRKDSCWAPRKKGRSHCRPQVTTLKEERFSSTNREAKWKKKEQTAAAIEQSPNVRYSAGVRRRELFLNYKKWLKLNKNGNITGQKLKQNENSFTALNVHTSAFQLCFIILCRGLESFKCLYVPLRV